LASWFYEGLRVDFLRSTATGQVLPRVQSASHRAVVFSPRQRVEFSHAICHETNPHFVLVARAALAGEPLQRRKSTPPKRLISICTGFGLYGPAFFPGADQAGRDYTPSEYLEVLGDVRKDCTVFSGISHPEIGGDHASESCFLTAAKHPRRPGFRNSVSMDYLAARHVGTPTRFPLLTLNTDDGGTSLTFTQSGASVSAEYSPSRLYTKLFLTGNPKEVEAETARLKADDVIALTGGSKQLLKPLIESAVSLESVCNCSLSFRLPMSPA